LGAALGSIAHSAIDLSDGLLADLGHILKASGDLGAEIEVDRLPLFKQAVALLGQQEALELALGGGDDYQLCFTAPEKRHQEILATGHRLDQDLFWIGRITEHGGCSIHGSEINLDTVSSGYQHVWPR
jgi:thiamine-monophosphate kinase